MCNIGPHLAFALDVRSKGFGRACPSLSTRVICHNIADSKLCSTKGYFVQLLVKSHHCFCWRDLEAEYLPGIFSISKHDLHRMHPIYYFLCSFVSFPKITYTLGTKLSKTPQCYTLLFAYTKILHLQN